MKKYKIVGFWFLGVLLFANCSPKLSNNIGAKPSEEGKCYAKVQFPAIYEEIEKSYLVYTGNDLSQEGLNVDYIVVTPEEQVWEKRKAGNCRSANPDDCLVWCLITKPAVKDTIVQVRDTSLVKEYRIETKTIEYLVQNYKVDWTEVHCEQQLNRQMVNKISMKLVELNYLANPTDKISKQLKTAVKNYQKDYDLAYGAFTVEFTDHLGL